MAGLLSRFTDSIQSLTSRMGTERDKAATTAYVAPILDDMQISIAYSSAWLPRKIVDIPALDACRKWRDWQAPEEQIELIEAEEKRLNLRGKVLEAMKKARLFGGAALLIGTKEADLSLLLEPERISKEGIQFIHVLTRRQLSAKELERSVMSPYYGQPSGYTLAGRDGLQVDIHPSRLVIFQGAMPADQEIEATAYQGWGDSVLRSTLDAIKHADATSANIASLVFEAKIDVIRIPELMAQIQNPEYENRLLKRLSLANTAKGINGTLILDALEEFSSKTINFSGFPDVLMSFLQVVAGAADIPVTRLLGQSPGGLNNTGTADMKNYHDRVQSIQELEMTPAMQILDECLIRSATGSRDPAIYYAWSPLEQMSEKERADIFKTVSEAARTLAGSNTSPAIVPVEALSDALVNVLTENGSLPGLQSAIDEYGSLADQGDDDGDIEASSTPRRDSERRETKDAAPRTMYVRRDVLNSAEIIEWAKSQGFTDIADDLHVTIAYSRTPVDWFSMPDAWSEKINLPAGGARQMEAMGKDKEYLALLIASSELEWRHKTFVEHGASWDWPDYQPHITIQIGGNVDLSKVEPYTGKITLGPEIFEEIKE